MLFFVSLSQYRIVRLMIYALISPHAHLGAPLVTTWLVLYPKSSPSDAIPLVNHDTSRAHAVSTGLYRILKILAVNFCTLMRKVVLTKTGTPEPLLATKSGPVANFISFKLAHSGPRLAAKYSHSHLSTWLLHRTSKYRFSCLSRVVLQSAVMLTSMSYKCYMLTSIAVTVNSSYSKATNWMDVTFYVTYAQWALANCSSQLKLQNGLWKSSTSPSLPNCNPSLHTLH